MNKPILTDSSNLAYYALKVNGRLVTPPMVNPLMLEEYRRNLPDDQKATAEVVSVTSTGTELLLG